MEGVVAFIAVAGTFTSIIVIAYLYFNSRHKERMALIQHGQQANIFKMKRGGSDGLKYGLLAVGVGLGLFFGSIVETVFNTNSPLPHFGMMLMFGGAGLILYYLIARKEDKPEDDGDIV